MSMKNIYSLEHLKETADRGPAFAALIDIVIDQQKTINQLYVGHIEGVLGMLKEMTPRDRGDWMRTFFCTHCWDEIPQRNCYCMAAD